MNSTTAYHFIVGASLAMISMFASASLIAVNSMADTVNTAAAISNASPVVNSVFISGAANGLIDAYAGGTLNDLVAGGTRTIHVNGVVQDGNGQDDIASVSAKFYRSGVGNGCTPSDNDCYVVGACTLDTTGVTNLRKRYNCTINVSYFADSTSLGGEFPLQNWVAEVTVADQANATGVDSATKEMQTLLALNVPATINYGSRALGSETDTDSNQVMTIAQAGNDVADVEVSSGAAMTCTLGSIPVGNQKWSTVDVAFSHLSAAALTGSSIDTNLGVGYRHGANPTKSLYWNIAIPSEGLNGNCAGNTTITAVSG